MVNPYYIVCVSNEDYVQHTAVMLCSLLETNRDKSFQVYFLTTGILKESACKHSVLCCKYGNTFVIRNCATNDIIDLPVGQWNIIMYLKLFIPHVLPLEVERCLFLDVDMIINADIKSLYEIDLQNKVLAAAEDIPDCVTYKSRLHLQVEDLYINSGVMVCDLLQWRTMELQRPIFEFVRTVADKINNEQDVIAMYFKGKITSLPIKWNMTTFYFRRQPKIFNKYLPQLIDARKAPGIIHFACPINPWFRDCQHPYKILYKRYLLMTDWKEYKFPIFEQMTAWGRTKRIVRNFLNCVGVMNDAGYNIK